ncbi:helix-turn-helix transcriptional regulator [Chromobacterium alticapitis]|uniref:helix-turn-helix transcriptional regulator n=1 Tax=Chromobacterium alticapitis TaxID=2073169 RepID=UPI0011AFF718
MRHAYRRFGPGALHTIRLLRALNYLWRHLDQSLLLDWLAAEACFSRFHFHRLYRNLMGETVMESRQRLLLRHAAGELGGARRLFQQSHLHLGVCRPLRCPTGAGGTLGLAVIATGCRPAEKRPGPRPA